MPSRNELLVRAAIVLRSIKSVMQRKPSNEEERAALQADLKVIEQKWKALLKELTDPGRESRL
jgi:hypothetical protein